MLTFKNAPDYEHPGDAGGNNVYDVVVSVSDGDLTDSQNVSITVTNVSEAPVAAAHAFGIGQTYGTSQNALWDSAHANYTINLAALGVITDPDGQTLTWSSSSLPNSHWTLGSDGKLVFDGSVSAGVYDFFCQRIGWSRFGVTHDQRVGRRLAAVDERARERKRYGLLARVRRTRSTAGTATTSSTAPDKTTSFTATSGDDVIYGRQQRQCARMTCLLPRRLYGG